MQFVMKQLEPCGAQPNAARPVNPSPCLRLKVGKFRRCTGAEFQLWGGSSRWSWLHNHLRESQVVKGAEPACLHASGSVSINGQRALNWPNLMSEVVGPMTPSSGNYWLWFEMFNGTFCIFLFCSLCSDWFFFNAWQFFWEIRWTHCSFNVLFERPTHPLDLWYCGVCLLLYGWKKSHLVVNLQFVWRNKTSFHQTFHLPKVAVLTHITSILGTWKSWWSLEFHPPRFWTCIIWRLLNISKSRMKSWLQ